MAFTFLISLPKLLLGGGALNYVSTATLSSHSSAEWYSTVDCCWVDVPFFARSPLSFIHRGGVGSWDEMPCDGVRCWLSSANTFLPASAARDQTKKWDICRGSNLRYGNRMTIYAPFRLSYLFFWLATLPTVRMTNGNEARKMPNGEENKHPKVRCSSGNPHRERVGKFTAKFVWHWWCAGGGPETGSGWTHHVWSSHFGQTAPPRAIQHGFQNWRNKKMNHDTTKPRGQNLHQLYWTIITLWTNIPICGATFRS